MMDLVSTSQGQKVKRCTLHSWMVPEFPDRATSTAKAITRCETHDWTFDGPPSLMCPIGRIEEAADKAIAKIRRANDDHLEQETRVGP